MSKTFANLFSRSKRDKKKNGNRADASNPLCCVKKLAKAQTTGEKKAAIRSLFQQKLNAAQTKIGLNIR